MQGTRGSRCLDANEADRYFLQCVLACVLQRGLLFNTYGDSNGEAHKHIKQRNNQVRATHLKPRTRFNRNNHLALVCRRPPPPPPITERPTCCSYLSILSRKTSLIQPTGARAQRKRRESQQRRRSLSLLLLLAAAAAAAASSSKASQQTLYLVGACPPKHVARQPYLLRTPWAKRTAAAAAGSPSNVPLLPTPCVRSMSSSAPRARGCPLTRACLMPTCRRSAIA